MFCFHATKLRYPTNDTIEIHSRLIDASPDLKESQNALTSTTRLTIMTVAAKVRLCGMSASTTVAATSFAFLGQSSRNYMGNTHCSHRAAMCWLGAHWTQAEAVQSVMLTTRRVMVRKIHGMGMNMSPGSKKEKKISHGMQ